MNKTALVTGASGFMGWHMVKLLLEKNYKVIASDIREPTDALFKNIKFVKANLTHDLINDNAALLGAINCSDLIFHIGGLFSYSASPYRLFETNVIGTRNLLRAIDLAGYQPRVVIWGAAGVFGNFDHIPLPATEAMPAKTDNPYLLSKLEQELVALNEGVLRSIPITVIRPSGVYGSRSAYGMAISITAMLKTKIAAVIGKGQHRASLVHVRDVVRSAEFLANDENAIGEIYHVTDDALHSVEKITRHLAKLCGAIFVPIKIPPWIMFQLAKITKIDRELIHLATVNAWLSNAKIKRLGFQFEYPDSKIGLTETVEWYKNNK